MEYGEIDEINPIIYTTRMYSRKLSLNYSKNRQSFTATDKEVFSNILKIGGVKNKSILDFGCGDGVYSVKFIEMGARSVVGTDTSSEMIKLAKEREVKNIKFIKTVGNLLPFKDNQFDIVFSNFVFHHIKKLESSLVEILRVLKKKGILIATLSAYDFDETKLKIKGTKIPVQLGSAKDYIVVDNLVKHHSDVKNLVQKSGFNIKVFKNIKNKNASIYKSYRHIDKVKKLTLLIVASK